MTILLYILGSFSLLYIGVRIGWVLMAVGFMKGFIAASRGPTRAVTSAQLYPRSVKTVDDI